MNDIYEHSPSCYHTRLGNSSSNLATRGNTFWVWQQEFNLADSILEVDLGVSQCAFGS